MSLFHYTDIQALKSILENNEIWMTDIRFLNDADEYLNGLKVLSEVVDRDLPPNMFYNGQYIDEAQDRISHLLAETEYLGMDTDPVFVFSLSENLDSLSQWRGYGLYCIEFDDSVLREHLPSLERCIYLQSEKYKFAESIITWACTSISSELGENDGSWTQKALDIYNNIAAQGAIFKHVGFVEECEIRSIYQLPETSDEIRFRTRGNMMIPYVPFKIPAHSIKRIHIGPMQDQELASKSLSACARRYQKRVRINNPEYSLDITCSEIPFRG